MAAKRNLQIVHGYDPELREVEGGSPRPESTGHRNPGEHLPAQPTPLLGRDDELEALSRAILESGARLLTLTGPGGVGKTRLAVEVATQVAHAFPDGVFFVDLAGTEAPEVLPSVICLALQTPDGDNFSTVSDLVQYLVHRRLLLVLDSFEHILASATDVGEIVARCPLVTVIVTSQAPLHLRWEHVQPIPPLAVPEDNHLPLTKLENQACIQLFVQRAQSIRTDFMLSSSNAGDIVKICRRLDGLPLAVELAASRLNVLTPSAILARLDTQSSLLQQTAPDVPTRHLSLQATLASSYSHLSSRDQSFLQRLAVFVDGFTLDAASAVCVPGEFGIDILEGLASLVDKSVVVASSDGGDEPRFRLLQTIDSYVLEHGQKDGEIESARQAHARYFLDLAEQAAVELSGPRQSLWFARLTGERANLMAALDWASRAEHETEVRLAIALTEFWRVHGLAREGTLRLADILVRRTIDDVNLRCEALDSLGRLAGALGKLEQARSAIDEALDLSRTAGSIELKARLLTRSGMVLAAQGHVDAAMDRLDHALALSQELQDTRSVALIIQTQGAVQLSVGALERAETLLAESLSIFQSAEDLASVIFGLLLLGRIAGLQGKTARAAGLFEQSLSMASDLNIPRMTLLAEEHICWLAASTTRPDSIGKLLGAIDAVRESIGLVRDPYEGSAYEDARAAILARSDEHNAAVWMATGENLTYQQTIEGARSVLSVLTMLATELQTADVDAGKLSKRELEVLQLVAQGFSNKEVAGHLIISENTAKFHVTSILGKLGANSRARMIALASQLKLLEDPE